MSSLATISLNLTFTSFIAMKRSSHWKKCEGRGYHNLLGKFPSKGMLKNNSVMLKNQWSNFCTGETKHLSILIDKFASFQFVPIVFIALTHKTICLMFAQEKASSSQKENIYEEIFLIGIVRDGNIFFNCQSCHTSMRPWTWSKRLLLVPRSQGRSSNGWRRARR